MPRPSQDGTPSQAPSRHKLTDMYVQRLRPTVSAFMIWDTEQKGLAVMVQPTGHKSWKCVYRRHGRPRWMTIGDVDAFGLASARKLAGRVMYQVAEGGDPIAERRAERGTGTFEELAARYVSEYAKRKNRSWKQSDDNVRRYLLPRWGKMSATEITRADVKAMMRSVDKPSAANQTLKAASAIFSWAIREDILRANPCTLVEHNRTRKRERYVSDAEMPVLWEALGSAGLVGSVLKVVLLTGQRPGEVRLMRREHVVDGWWRMPGEPVPDLGWNGTKNHQSHDVWLAPQVRSMVDQMAGTGHVFAAPGDDPLASGDLSKAMREICERLGIANGVTAHDLRRTFSTRVTRLQFGRDAMNRVTNHREGGIADVYDQHGYADENKRIMETVAKSIINTVRGTAPGNVVAGKFGRRK